MRLLTHTFLYPTPDNHVIVNQVFQRYVTWSERLAENIVFSFFQRRHERANLNGIVTSAGQCKFLD